MALSTTRLGDRAAIEVAGPDARVLLHDILTADIADLGDGMATHAALLTPQGKILFDLFVVAQGDGFLLDCAAAQAEALIRRLTLYRLRRAVTFTLRDDLAVAAAWGEAEAPPLAGGIVYADPRLAAAGFRLIVPRQSADSLANAAPAAYHAHRIGLGLPDSEADIGSGAVFPHEANMDLLAGVSFTKGCYVGQEVVARMQHRGTARSRFVPVTAAAPLPAPGSEVTAGGRRIGKLTSVAGHSGLALLRLDRLGDGAGLAADGVAVEAALPEWLPRPGGEA